MRVNYHNRFLLWESYAFKVYYGLNPLVTLDAISHRLESKKEVEAMFDDGL